MVKGSTSRATIALLALAATLALPAGAAASGPGVDEYTLNIPGAGGNHPFQGGPPTGHTGSLPGPVQGQLGGTQGGLLGAVATSPELGAPGRTHHQGGKRDGSAGRDGGQTPAATPPSSSFTGAALRTAGDTSSLVLLGGIVALAAVASGSLLRLRTR